MIPNEIILEILYYVDYILIPFLPFVNHRFNDLISWDGELRCVVFDFSTDPYRFLRLPSFFQYKTLVCYLFESIRPKKFINWPKIFKDDPKLLYHLPNWFISEFLIPHKQTCHQLLINLWESLITMNRMKMAHKVYLHLQNWIIMDSWSGFPQFPKSQRVLENILISQCNWKWFNRWFGKERIKTIPDDVIFKCVSQITDIVALKQLVHFWCDLHESDEMTFWNCWFDSDTKIKHYIGKIKNSPPNFLEYLFKYLPQIQWLDFIKNNNGLLSSHFAHFLKQHYCDGDIAKRINLDETNIYTLPFELLLYLRPNSSRLNDQKRSLLIEKAIESGNRDSIIWCLQNINMNDPNIKISMIYYGSDLSGRLIFALKIVKETALVDIDTFSSRFDISVSLAIEIYEKYRTLFNFKLSPESVTAQDLSHFAFWEYYFRLNPNLWPESTIFRVLRKVFEWYQVSSNIHDAILIAKFLKFIKKLFPDLQRSQLYRCSLDLATQDSNCYLLDHVLKKYYNLSHHNIFPQEKSQSRNLFLKRFPQPTDLNPK